MLQPTITMQELIKADEYLMEFCLTFELLYSKEHCSPNMHMNLHIRESILNYGPSPSFWCFPFERYNGILGSLQKNWIKPEVQMIKKFLNYQSLLMSNISTALPPQLKEFFEMQLGKQSTDIMLTEGSVEQSHADASSLLEFKANHHCTLSSINATYCSLYKTNKKYEKFFDYEEVAWLTVIYKTLHTTADIMFVPMAHERFNEVTIAGEKYVAIELREIIQQQ